MKTAVKDVMSTRVFWVRKNTSFKEMADALSEYRISALPVLDEEYKVIGVVSEADLLTKEALNSEPEGMPGMITGLLRRKEHEKARGTTAGDFMTSPPVTVTPDDTLERAARLMYTRKVKRLPVVNANGRLVGIVSRSDLLSTSWPVSQSTDQHERARGVRGGGVPPGKENNDERKGQGRHDHPGRSGQARHVIQGNGCSAP